jgi:hypothetical protein
MLSAGSRTGGRLTGNIRFGAGGGGRFLGRFSLSAFCCTLLSCSAGLFHRAGLLRGGLGLGRFRAGLCFGSLRFFSTLLLLW